MPKIIKKLTRKEIEARPSSTAQSSKPERRNDGNGLTLLVYPSGKRSWMSRYYLFGKRTDYIFATYDEMKEIEARERNQHIHALAKQNIDPKSHFNDDKSAKELTFGFITQEWLEFRKKEGVKDKEAIRRLNKHVLPKIGHIPHHAISKQLLQDTILNPVIENGTLEEAKRIRLPIKQVLDFAIEKYEKVDTNVAQKLQIPRPKPKPFPAITIEHEFRDFLQAVWDYEDKHPRATVATISLLKLSILLYLRPSELRCLEWRQYDKKEQMLYAYSSKVDVEHTIKLPTQAIEILAELEKHKINEFMFPTNYSNKQQSLSEAAGRKLLERIGYKGKQTMHGLRASARTILEEELRQETKYLESQLTHKNNDKSKGAYNRSPYVTQRGEVLQLWADYLDALRTGKNLTEYKDGTYIIRKRALQNMSADTDSEKMAENLIKSVGIENLLKHIDKEQLRDYLETASI